MILGIKNDRRVGPLQGLARIKRWLCCIDLTHPLFKSTVGRMQRGASVDAHGLCSFLKLVLTRLFILFTIIIPLILVTAPSGPLLLLLGIAVATSSATTLLARPLCTVLGLLFIS